MKQQKHTFLLPLLISVTAMNSACQAEQTVRLPESQAVKSLQLGAGMQVHIDPTTGELLQEPPSPKKLSKKAAAKAAMEQAVQSSAEPLQIKDSPVPGGGQMVDLQGRYQSPLEAKVNSHGQPAIQHHEKHHR